MASCFTGYYFHGLGSSFEFLVEAFNYGRDISESLSSDVDFDFTDGKFTAWGEKNAHASYSSTMLTIGTFDDGSEVGSIFT